MDEGLYTREPRDEASSDTERVRTHATKLKNKDSARRYYEKKLRNGKADNRDSAEEQMRKETARCLGCGASFVDPNKCLGCGVCTTRCKFDAIHLRKRTYQESIPYAIRPKVLPEFIAGRQKRIEIRRISEE